MLSTLAWLAFGFCLAAGPILTSDILSVERREGTLGLLFLTDLRGIDVVLGKLVAASVAAVFGLLAVLPVLAISVLLGGVQGGELIRVALVLVNTLFLSLALGILASVLCVQGRSALALTGFALFVLAGLGTAEANVGWAAQAGLGSLLARSVSPVCAMQFAWSSNYRSWPLEFWLSLGTTHLMGWICLIVGGWLTGSVWREPTGWIGQVVRCRLWRDWYYGSSASRRSQRAVLDQNPIAWLRWRHQLKRWLLWGAVGCALVFWVLFRWRYSQFADSGAAVFMVGMWLLGPLKWLAASEASHQLVADLQSGALELVLTTPLSVDEILRGHIRSLDRLFLWPAAAVVGVQAIMLSIVPDPTHFDRELVGLAIVGMVMALWDLRALAWVGMWLGLKLRRADRAFAGAVQLILLLPWLMLFAILVGTAAAFTMTPVAPPRASLWTWENVAVLWFVLCVCTNLAFGLIARLKLRLGFRHYAAGQHGKGV